MKELFLFLRRSPKTGISGLPDFEIWPPSFGASQLPRLSEKAGYGPGYIGLLVHECKLIYAGADLCLYKGVLLRFKQINVDWPETDLPVTWKQIYMQHRHRTCVLFCLSPARTVKTGHKVRSVPPWPIDENRWSEINRSNRYQSMMIS